MALRLMLDGTLIPKNEHSNIDDTPLTRTRANEDGPTEIGFSTGVEFYGDAYEYVYNALVTDGNARFNSIDVKVIDDCCGDAVIYQGELNSSRVDWCVEDCVITADILEKDLDTDATNCVQSTLVFDNSLGFQDKQHPFFRHCTDPRPNFTQIVLLILAALVTFGILPAIFAIGLIGTYINLMIAAINTIPGVDIDYIGGDNINFFDDAQSIGTAINSWVSGCQYGHPAPLVRDYVKNVCDICGLTFESSILNEPTFPDGEPNPYYNMVWFEAPVNKGSRDYRTWIDDNKPIRTLKQFLDMLKTPFNADWQIRNGVLRFEEQDFFEGPAVGLDASDTENYPGFVSLCFEYLQAFPPAFSSIRYTNDGVDWVGNEAAPLYSDIIDWNPPGGINRRLKGEDSVLIEFSPARFRADAIGPTAVETFQDIANLTIAGTLLDLLFLDDRFDHVLLLPQDLTFIPKLLIWDGNSIRNAKVLKQKLPDNLPNVNLPGGFTLSVGGILRFLGFDLYDYNTPMWINPPENRDPANYIRSYVAGDNSKRYIPGNLYDRFLHKRDPTRQQNNSYQYTLTLNRDCELLTRLTLDKGVKLTIPGQTVKLGTIEQIRIGETQVTITGKV